jgi:hypothetical protein
LVDLSRCILAFRRELVVNARLGDRLAKRETLGIRHAETLGDTLRRAEREMLAAVEHARQKPGVEAEISGKRAQGIPPIALLAAATLIG